MAEATTRGVPSQALREYIARKTESGTRLGAEVVGFALPVRNARQWFARQVEPLELSDEDYEQMAAECGLTRLLDLTEGIGESLASVAAA